MSIEDINNITSKTYGFQVGELDSDMAPKKPDGMFCIRNLYKKIDVKNAPTERIAEICHHVFESHRDYVHPDSSRVCEPVNIYIRNFYGELNLRVYGYYVDDPKYEEWKHVKSKMRYVDTDKIFERKILFTSRYLPVGQVPISTDSLGR